MKKALIFLCCLFLAVALLPVPQAEAAYNQVLETEKFYSEVILLVNLDNGTVLFDKNADMITSPASLTKIVVASLVLDKVKDMEAIVTVPEYTIRMLDNTGSSNVGLKPGEKMSVINLLHCMLIPSANEAANILADYAAGSVATFVEEMNAFVKGLGCENTSFMNPHGLDEEGQYTTANDMYKIVTHAMKNPLFEQITAKQKYTVPATNMSPQRNLVSTVFLMNRGIKDYYYEYATGIKTGSTKGAGRCVISKASKDGYSYIAVIMRSPFINIDSDSALENCAFIDAKALFKWTFENIRLRTVAQPEQIITEVPVKLSWQADYVQLVPDMEYTALMPGGAGAGSVLIEPVAESIPATLDAPVKKGQPAGEARVLYAGEEIARIKLIANSDISRNVLLYAGSLLKTAASTIVFKIIAIIVLFLIFAYAALIVWMNMRKKKRKKLKVINYRDVHKK
jgi:serine-type D-Ala-D-Ala carboxypeptidase (penicillin-binding protein 5/6)